MKNISTTLVAKNKSHLLFLTLILCGCSSLPLNKEGNNVIVSTNPATNNCKYIGEVVGSSGKEPSGFWTSNKDLTISAMNDLRNNAGKLGANYVQMISVGIQEHYNVTNIGNAYHCIDIQNKK